jgi:dTDP-4-dehydrorhamnose reductase
MSKKLVGKVLITGVHGQLGRALAAACGDRGLNYEGRDIDTLDIRNPHAVDNWITAAQPSTVVNCAAFTAVDDCETNEGQALTVNGTAVGYLASACDRVGARLVQISTDYVFTGNGDRPYTEEDAVGPVSAYGRTKLRGEEHARSFESNLVVRTAWLYGRDGSNFVETMRGQIDRGAGGLEVVDDQRGCPTFCDDLADAILDLIDAGATGLVHAVNAGDTTWHGFAVEIAHRLGADIDIRPVATKEFPRPAPRPAYSVLDTSRLESILERPMPPWQDALARYLERPCAP